MSDGPTLPADATITDCGDECEVQFTDGEKWTVPKDAKNREWRMVQAAIADGHGVATGDTNRPRRRARSRMRDDPLWNALTRYLAKKEGRTVAQVRNDILAEL